MDKSFQKIMQEQMDTKGIDIAKIRQQTGITETYLNAFIQGNEKKLPAAPYVRGYIFKIATILELDGEELWQSFKNGETIKKSGSKDLLPSNRYALKKINKKLIIGTLIIILIATYGIINFNRFLGNPKIEISSPAAETLVTTANTITLIGKLTADGKLTIDGAETLVDEFGNFRREYTLSPGLNRIEFAVRGILSQETKVIRQVIYQP